MISKDTYEFGERADSILSIIILCRKKSSLELLEHTVKKKEKKNEEKVNHTYSIYG